MHYCITRVQTVSNDGYFVSQITDRVGPFEDRLDALQWLNEHPEYEISQKPGTHVRIKVDSLLEGIVHPDDYEA